MAEGFTARRNKLQAALSILQDLLYINDRAAATDLELAGQGVSGLNRQATAALILASAGPPTASVTALAEMEVSPNMLGLDAAGYKGASPIDLDVFALNVDRISEGFPSLVGQDPSMAEFDALLSGNSVTVDVVTYGPGAVSSCIGNTLSDRLFNLLNSAHSGGADWTPTVAE